MKKELIKNKKIKIISKYFLILIFFTVFCRAEIFGCRPFGVALLFALMWTGFNPYVISSQFFAVEMCQNFSLENLYINIVIVFVLLVVYLLHIKTKKTMNVWLVGLYLLISISCWGYYTLVAGEYVRFLIFVTTLVVSFALFSLALQVAILRGLYYKLTLNESIAFSYILIVFGLGVEQFCLWGFSLTKFFAVASVLFLSIIKKDKIAYISSLGIAVGGLLGGASGDMVANIVIILLASGLFRDTQKYYMSCAVILADFCFQVILDVTIYETILSLGPTILATIIVLAIPQKLISKIQDRFYITESEMSMRNIVNLTRSNLHRRFNELANAFFEMKAIHLGLIKDNIGQDQLVKMLADELKNNMCKDCLNKGKCFRSMGEESVILGLVRVAVKKGKLTLLDVPSNLSIRCGMINLLIGKINQLILEYKRFLTIKQDVNNIKFLLAEQIGAVGQIMLELGTEIDKRVRFDSHKESQIIVELLAENIVCSEVLFYNENEQDLRVDLIVKGDNAFNPKIEEIISKKLKKKMIVVSSKPIEISNFYAVSLETESNFDIVFGLASYTKTGSNSSGDSHSLLKLGKNKYLVALCDGMGSGEEANRTSALTIGLIENFYKAGFDNDIVVSSINKLLSLNNQENFATLDLCLINLDNQILDFVKVGAPFSVVKRDTEIEKIEGGALPVGVLDSVKPFCYQTTIDTKSMIVMMTDGITDAFKDVDSFNDFVKGIASTNPQTIAQTVIDEAVRRTDNINKDDMTILVVRTFRKTD